MNYDAGRRRYDNNNNNNNNNNKINEDMIMQSSLHFAFASLTREWWPRST